MSSSAFEPASRCIKCGQALAAGALVCPNCRTLVHAAQLQSISANARSLEAGEHFTEAREQWFAALPLLPEESQQAAWIRNKIAELDNSISYYQQFGKPQQPSPVRATAIAFVVSFALFVAFESMYGGPAFGFGFSVLILIHEFGHFIDVRRRGMKADLPVFVPGLGAFVRFRSPLVSSEVRAGVSLAGPCAGLISSAACAVVWYVTGDKYWASLAQSGAWLNLLNLTPVWVLDGGQAAQALNRAARIAILITALLMWRVTGEKVYFIVAAGALFRSFAKPESPKPSYAMTAYFIALLVLLGVVMYLVPGTGFGIQ